MEIINFNRIDGLHSDYQRRVAATIADVFPTVRLLRMEPGHPAFDPQRPFALVDEPTLAPPYHIRNLHESEIDHRLLAWLLQNNTHDSNSQVSKIQLLEMAYAALEAKREEEYRAEKKDIMKSIMKSKKNEFRHDGTTLRK